MRRAITSGGGIPGEEVSATVGSKIRRWRKERGLSQSGLSRRSGYSAKTISNWERGEYTPSLLALMDISVALDVTPNDLLPGMWKG